MTWYSDAMHTLLQRRDGEIVFPKVRFVGAVMLIVAFLMALLAIHTQSYFGDEGFHFEQLRRYNEGDFSIDYQLTMLPGYHLVLRLFAWATGIHSLNFYRLINVAFSLLSVAVFRAILANLHKKPSTARVMQYAFLPILFPYFLFLYTDAFSLLIVLLSLWALFRRWYASAAVLSIASMAVRQNNVMWHLFFVLIFLWEEWPGILRMIPRWSMPRFLSQLRARFRSRSNLWLLLLALVVFAAGFVLFVAFVIWNGGVAIGDKQSHPFPSFHAGNIFFCLFLSFFLFLPLHVGNIRVIGMRLRESPLLLPLFILFFLFYMLTFQNDHWYNQGLDSVYFRNRILAYFTSTPSLKVLFFLPAGFAFLSLWVTRLVKPYAYLLYPVTVLYLLPSWLIEQRYYFIPLVLFLLLREQRSKLLENTSALLSVMLAFLLFIPVALRWFFL